MHLFLSHCKTICLNDLTDSLTKIQSEQEERPQASPLQIALESSKKTVIQGSMDLLLVTVVVGNLAACVTILFSLS